MLMGFPAPVFSECEVPRLLLNLLFLLAHLRRISSWPLRLIGAGIQYDDLSFDRPSASGVAEHRLRQEQHHYHQDRCLEELEEHSPAMRFDALSTSGDDTLLLLPESCAVCLGDFHAATRVRRPRWCRHVFHRACLDRWAAQGHSTCPLCRAPFLLSLPLPAS